MTDLFVVAGGLLAAILVVGGLIYFVLGRTLDIEWDSGVEGEESFAPPEE